MNSGGFLLSLVRGPLHTHTHAQAAAAVEVSSKCVSCWFAVWTNTFIIDLTPVNGLLL